MTRPDPVQPETEAAPEGLPRGTALASFIAAKLCHDFISPAGAIVSGLDLLKDPSAQDMRDDAMSLIEASAGKLVQIVNFARVAFGAATTAERFDAAELEALVRDTFSHMRADLDWDVHLAVFEKPAARALLNLAQIGGGALPMGGTASVTVRDEPESLVMTVDCKGLRARLKPETLTGLKGEALTEGLAGQWIQGFWLYEVVREAGGVLTVQSADEAVVLEARIPR